MIKLSYKWTAILLVILTCCTNGNTEEPPLYNVSTFPDFYRGLAMAIENEDTLSIVKMVKDKGLDVNYKDLRYGISLLGWSISNRKYNSCKKLLELGANPNQKDSLNEAVPAITVAAEVNDNSAYLKLLLEHGGNPNIVSNNIGELDYDRVSPLCAAASSSLANVKLLVEYGADINFCPKSNFLPLTTSLITSKIEITRYLTVEKKADIHKVFSVGLNNDTSRIADLLRLNIFDLNSKEYKEKKEVIDYLKTIGVDYKAAPIPKYLLNRPKEFLDNY